MRKNIGQGERVARAVIGVALIVAAYLWTTGWMQILAYIVAGVSLATAVTGYCAVYDLVKK